MNGAPSFPPKNPGQRPTSEGAKVVRGRTERMSKPARPARPTETAARSEAPRLRNNRPALATDNAPRADNGTPPPTYAPRRQGTAQRAARPEPLGLPMDERPEPAVPAQRGERPRRTAVAAPAPARPRKRFRGRRIIVPLLLVLVVALVAWPLYLYSYGNSKLNHVNALSGAADTPGRTILFAGTDKRSEEGINDGVEGQRSDSIMLVHIPESGNPSLISLPRDTYVEIPGYGAGKLNSAYSRGGPELLVETVEDLSGLTIDHYVEVGMDGIANLVDAVGSVELCLDYDVSDSFSGLEWEAGCHDSDGTTALAFSRMRYADPLGDIGRTARQRQVIAQVINEVMTPSVLLNPFKQRDVVGSTAEVLTVDQDTNLLDLVRVAMPLRGIMGPDGIIGTPPIADMNYHPGGVGSTVLLDPNTVDEFFAKVRDGSITQDDVAVNLP